MAVSFYMKTFDHYSPYRLLVWPLVLVVSYAGFWYPKLGLPLFPMFAGIMVLGFLRGRYWCGNYCPRGALMDTAMRKLGSFRRIPAFFRSFWFRAAALVLLMGMFTRNVVGAFDYWGQAAFWDKLGMAGVMMCAVTTTIGVALALTINPRTWCSFCPMGSVQKLLHLLKRKITGRSAAVPMVTLTEPDACLKCGTCARVCPMQLAPYRERNAADQVDAPDCLKCSTCVAHCRGGVLALEGERREEHYTPPAPKPAYAGRRSYQARVAAIEELAPDVREFTFALPEPERMDFEPGQFLTMQIDGEQDLHRAYTISSPGPNHGTVKIAVKRDPRGYGTPIIFGRREGDPVKLEGPMGDFTLKNNGRDLLLAAGGIGITPFVSMVRHALENGPRERRVRLVHGLNTESDIIYREYFEDLARRYPNFEYTIVLWQPVNGWTGARGLVTEALASSLPAEADVYLCGPPAMVAASRKKLRELGVAEENITAENLA